MALAGLLAVWLAPASNAHAEAGTLAARLTPEVMAVVYPDAEKLGPEEGKPPAIAVYKGGVIAGYVFSTLDIVAAPGYSSVPFDVIAGVDTSGRITGAKVIFHREPYIMEDKVRQPLLDRYLASHRNLIIQGGNSGMLPPDFVTGASTSARTMRAAIFDSAKLVLRGRGGRPSVNQPTLDLEGYQLETWEQLLAQGSIVRRTITSGEVATALEKAGAAKGAIDEPLGKTDATYIDFYVALATPATIGRNVLGSRNFDDYITRLARGGQVLLMGSKGPFDFQGTEHYKAANGHKFDRIRLVQGAETIEFTNSEFQRLGTGGAGGGVRALDYAALFVVPAGAKFNPLEPWRIDLMVHAQTPEGRKTAVIPVTYQLPAAHILMPDVPAPPVWVEAWNDSRTNVAILGVMLGVLTLILAFQGRLTRSRRAHRYVRIGFLLFTLVWLGWVAGAQLSIVNVVNYVMAPFRHFDIGFYLTEPLMVMITVYTVISLLLLGRGVFCGWLCPFGALQELLGQTSRLLGLPQWNPSEALQRRLWWGKYISAAVVLGVAFVSLDMAVTAAEVEPFKTAITSHFTRAWPYLIYAGGLVAIGLFTERAYCRFLCPLGGVLALLDRLHLIDLLKRRPECGSPCHLCERSCPVKAIEKSGKIIMAECFQCLDCQVEYYDDQRCPPLAAARKKEVRRSASGRLPAAAATARNA